ncbi:MAG: CRTAC1 family protein [Pseudomonadota bacterium]
MQRLKWHFILYLLVALCPGLAKAEPLFVQATAAFNPPTTYYPRQWHRAIGADLSWREKYARFNQAQGFAGGIAARDINGDHRIDIVSLYQGGYNRYDQLASGRFEHGLQQESGNSGLLIADINHDGELDLMVGEAGFFSVDSQAPTEPSYHVHLGPDWLKKNDCMPLATNERQRNSYSFAMGDVDLNGLNDLVTSNWTLRSSPEEPRLWLAQGGCNYTPAEKEQGLYGHTGSKDLSFTPILSDLNNNGLLDLLVASDFETSQYFINRGNGRFANQTNPLVIDDQNGMGATAADFNNDGLIDWFVTAVYDRENGPKGLKDLYANWGGLGNRLYQNTGNGQFRNVSEAAGINDGAWGWGACAADFNNDGHLDIYHVNGFLTDDFKYHASVDGKFSEKPSRLFINNGDGTFSERAAEWGLDEPNEGRGVACFDHGRDGDIDLAYSQGYGETRLFINRLNDSAESFGNYFGIIPQGIKGNLAAAGAKIYVFPDNHPHQMREIQLGGNFLGQHPPEAHFGLGNAERIKTVLIQWPGKPARYTTIQNIEANQWVVAKHPDLVRNGEKHWYSLSDQK